MLLTYTQRCTRDSGYNNRGRLGPPSEYNAPVCPTTTPDGYGTGLLVRAILAHEDTATAGALSFDTSQDVIIIKAQDDNFDAYGCVGN